MTLNSATPTDFKTIQRKLIESESDILSLDIINWNHLNGYWSNTAEALHTIASWFINTAYYSIMEADLREAPQRDDFPGWKHVGDHERVGQLYWNWFHHCHNGELHFSDSPDFYGTLRWADGSSNNFYGDIGKVSPMAIALTQKHMTVGDLWISIVSERKQIIIEPVVDLNNIWVDMILGE